MACLAALHAFQAADAKLPVNLVLVCEGEEEIGSPNFRQVVFKPEVEAALKKCVGIIIPLGNQDPDGSVQINLGAKGVVELELVASGEKWGRGPSKDVHSSLAAQVDSPAWHLDPGAQHARASGRPHAGGRGLLREGAPAHGRAAAPHPRRRRVAKTQRGSRRSSRSASTRWIADASPGATSIMRLVSQPTINIEGLVGGYTGPGGKTILPHRAVAKIDMRLVPDMTAKDDARAAARRTCGRRASATSR